MQFPDKRTINLTADDAPVSVNATAWLGRAQRALGGKLGFGGPGQTGIWLRFTNAKKAKILAIVNYVRLVRT